MDKNQGIKARATSRRQETYTNRNALNTQQHQQMNREYDDRNYYEQSEDEYFQNSPNVKSTYKSNNSSRRKKRNKKRGKGKFFAVLLVLAVLLGIIGTTVYIEKFGLSKVEMNLSEYYGAIETNELVVILNNEIQEERAIEAEGMQYLPYDLVNNKVNEKIYWDYNENLLLYSYADYTEEVKVDSYIRPDGYGYTVAMEKNETLYISMEYIVNHTDVEYSTFENPNRITVQSDWSERDLVTATKDTQVRYRGGVKSEILTYVTKGEELYYRDSYGDWAEVATKDGFIGYVQEKCISKPSTDTPIRTFKEEVYSSIQVDYAVNLGWHQTTNLTSNGGIDSILSETSGLTTIAPTWFFMEDTTGGIKSLASKDYVDNAHSKGLDVWATLNDFDGAIGSHNETYVALSKTSTRKKIISTVMKDVLAYNIDGINVDIELVSTATGNHFIQFLRELSIECRKNNIVLSVDNYPPKIFNQHFEYAEQGQVVDYVIIMGYDEYYSGSKEAGPVSSITYVEEGIREMLTMVPAEKIINAVPFYSRLFAETPKTTQEIQAQYDTEDAEYLYNVSSISLTMNAAYSRVSEAGVSTTWDDVTKHNYATWVEGDKTYKLWIEDKYSIEEKLKIMQKYNVAGVAAWKLGIENSEVWSVINSYY